MAKHRLEKYPPYPAANWDYGVKQAAAQDLRPPNKFICIYCRGQAKDMEELAHAGDCPAREDGNGW